MDMAALVVGSLFGGAAALAWRELAGGQWRGRMEAEMKEVIRRLGKLEEAVTRAINRR